MYVCISAPYPNSCSSPLLHRSTQSPFSPRCSSDEGCWGRPLDRHDALWNHLDRQVTDRQSTMHLMNFDPDFDLMRGHPIGQPDEISSGMFANVDKPSVKLNDGPDIKLSILVGLGRSFLSVAWPTGVQLLVFFCSSVPVVLFDTPGTSRCRSQHVSVESSSLLHQSIYLWFICFTWWSIDELETSKRTEQLYVLSHDRSWGWGWAPVKPV